MSKVLYITANPKKELKSFSLQVGRKFIEEYKCKNPKDEVVEIDVYSDYIPLIDKDILDGWDILSKGGEFKSLSDDQQKKVVRFGELTEQFMGADKYVFVSPMWNLTIPTMLGAYLDTISIAGKTFKYTEKGPIGLLEGKKAIHIQAAGGIYSDGPAKHMEFGYSYLKNLLNFIGVSDVNSVFVEGVAYDPNNAETIKNEAINKAKSIANNF